MQFDVGEQAFAPSHGCGRQGQAARSGLPGLGTKLRLDRPAAMEMAQELIHPAALWR